MIALIHIKKTAGKSLKHIMRCEFGAAHCDVKRWHRDDAWFSAADLRRLRRVYPWLQSIAGHSVRPYSDLKHAVPTLRYYTFLRDPIARCISEYQYCVRQGRWPDHSFAEWIQDPRFRNVQVKSLSGEQNLERACRMLDEEIAFVGLMERFDESLALMASRLDVPVLHPRRGRVNAASSHAIRDRLRADPEAMAAVRKANTLDLALYEHARNVFARQRAAAAGPKRFAAPRLRYNTRFVGNGVYRFGVYRPVMWAYRAIARANA